MPRLRPARALRRLEELRLAYGDGDGAAKRQLLEVLARAKLASAAQVLRLHEALCFLRAYPDDRPLLHRVESMLAAFAGRRDLRRFRAELASSGIAGTRTYYSFFWFTALWLARRWPEKLEIDWRAFDKSELLASRMAVLMTYGETLALEEIWLPARRWIERLKGPGETDAAFLLRRFDAIRASPFWKEQLFEELDLPCYLEPGETTPSRTRERWPASPVVFQRAALETSRAAFAGALRRPPRAVRRVRPRTADKLIALAREAMVARARDLDVFVHAERRDVRLMDCGRGLQFACYGAVAERRQMLDAVYGFLILKNGVPIGYFLTSALYRSALVAYNVFDTFRGAEAAYVYGRGLAMVRHVFDADAFGIETYQLGDHNREALASGAWWFYYKLGFRPRDPEVLAVVDRELARIRKNRRHRSSIATLKVLSAVEMYLFLQDPRDDVIGLISRETVGERLSRYLAERFGADRERGERVAAREAAALLGAGPRRRWTAGERLAWRRWAPLVLILPGIERWSDATKKALVAVVRAKGGPDESEFVRRFDCHQPLRRAILRLATPDPDAG